MKNLLFILLFAFLSFGVNSSYGQQFFQNNANISCYSGNCYVNSPSRAISSVSSSNSKLKENRASVRVTIDYNSYQNVLSGVIIGSSLNSAIILTNNHAFDSTTLPVSAISIGIPGHSRSYKASLLYRSNNSSLDIAVLHINPVSPVEAIPISLTSAPLIPGDVVSQVGYPNGSRRASRKTGKFVRYLKTTDKTNPGTLSFPVVSGESGSPVFFKGKVVGIIWGSDENHKAHFLRSFRLKNILNRIRQRYPCAGRGKYSPPIQPEPVEPISPVRPEPVSPVMGPDFKNLQNTVIMLEKRLSLLEGSAISINNSLKLIQTSMLTIEQIKEEIGPIPTFFEIIETTTTKSP